MNLCGKNEFCAAQLSDEPVQILAELYQSMVDDPGIIPCIDFDFQPFVLKLVLFGLLIDVPTRILIPAVVYRMNRCNNKDKQALNNLFSIFISQEVVSTNDTVIVLGINIILSEMWNGMDYNNPGLSYD